MLRLDEDSRNSSINRRFSDLKSNRRQSNPSTGFINRIELKNRRKTLDFYEFYHNLIEKIVKIEGFSSCKSNRSPSNP